MSAGRFSTGSQAIDAALGGGLGQGAVHEIFATGLLDEPSAASFGVTLAVRAAGNKPIVWVRQDFVGLELGEIYAPGLAELGLSPDRLMLVRVRDGPGVLRAGEEAARCPPLGAVIIEPWGNPKALDLAASRRLSLAAARSNVPLFLMRAGGAPSPSAASTRWRVRSAPSSPLEGEAPGHPAFAVELLRDRAGSVGRTWIVEWNRDRREFRDIQLKNATISRSLVSLSAGGPGDAPDGGVRQAG